MAARTFQIRRDGRRRYNAHLSAPPLRRGPGVLLLHEAHGLNEDIRRIADRYAAAGYVVLAPNLFWRRKGLSAFAYCDGAAAREAIGDLGGEDVLLPEVASAFDAFRLIPEFDGSSISIIGYGLGGVLALKAVCFDWTRPNAVISFYGGARDLLPLAPAIRPALQFHFAEHDGEAGLYRDSVAAFRGRVDVEIMSYADVANGFALAGRPEHCPDTAELAHKRALTFLSKSRHVTRAA